MRGALLYVLAAVFLAVIVSVAWWSREYLPSGAVQRHAVTQAASVEDLAGELNVDAGELARLNGLEEDAEVGVGGTLVLPPHEPSLSDTLRVHAVGLVAEMVGVFMSFWLAMVAGLLPAHLRRQILGIAVVLGLASYSATQSMTSGVTELTPQFVFGAIKDGFAWSAAFPLFARAFGLREEAA